jgi:hypothetical protein
MATLVKPWNDGGNLSVTYDGSGDGSAVFTSDTNEGIDREMSVFFKGAGQSIERVVKQKGLREIFNEDFILADGGTFNVLKVEEPSWRDTYKEVEYLESTGTQYINTNVKVTPDYTVEVTFVMTQRKATWDTLFGTRSGNTARFTARWANSATGKLGVHRSKIKTASYESYDDANATKTMVTDTWHTIKLAKREYTFDGQLRNTFSATTGTTAFSYPIFLFALCNSGSPADYGYFRIKKARMWNDKDELIRDYIPCVDLDGVGGMYDVVNDTFTKSGSSTKFNVGPLIK